VVHWRVRVRGVRSADRIVLGVRGCVNAVFTSLAVTVAALPEVSAKPAAMIASTEKGWPQFRGIRRDGVSDERGLAQTWPEAGPPILWSAKGAGKGFSSTIVADGRLYVTGDFNAECTIVAYDLAGKPLWRAKNGEAWLNQYQGARASVTFNAGHLYHENAHGRVVCLEAATGREVWAVNVLETFRGENITWGLSECLLVDERAVYVTAGGRDALVVALDKNTGAVLWRSEPLKAAGEEEVESATYVSPILVTFGGKRLLVGCSARTLFAVDADTGKLQWHRRRPTPYAVQAMIPTLVGDAIFMAAPLGSPGVLYRLKAPTETGAEVGVEESWTSKLDTCQGGVVYMNGRLYGSYYPKRGGWAAVNAETGEVLYEAMEFAKGSAIWADRRLYSLCEDGWMVLFEPTSTEFAVRGKFRFVTAKDRDAWAHPVIVGGRMYLRYHDTITCYDVREAGK
jgi:outer membrane protein assembly factor BamB